MRRKPIYKVIRKGITSQPYVGTEFIPAQFVPYHEWQSTFDRREFADNKALHIERRGEFLYAYADTDRGLVSVMFTSTKE